MSNDNPSSGHDPPGEDRPGPAPGPDLRAAVRDYVRTLHRSYLDAGGGGAGASLAAGRFTVVAAAARSLHLVATRDPLDVELPSGGAVDDSADGLSWQLAFLDVSVAPGLGDVPEGPEEIAAVKRVLGVRKTLYHLAVGIGSALSAHHATHAGAGLAHRETGTSG